MESAMSISEKDQRNIIVEIWNSFRATPGWVQFWMVFLLMPINMASLFFLNEPMCILIAFLANIGMLMNIPVMLYDRGISKLMSIPHLLPWTVLVLLIMFHRPEATGFYNNFLWALLTVNLISLAFDYVDSYKWIKGDRAIAS